jgi:hypothetical protein
MNLNLWINNKRNKEKPYVVIHNYISILTRHATHFKYYTDPILER